MGSLSTGVESSLSSIGSSLSSTNSNVGSLSTGVESSLSSIGSSLSSANSTVVDNATKADLNTVYAVAGNNQVLINVGVPNLTSSGVSLSGGSYVDGATENVTAYALLNGNPTATVKYGPSNILWGYSPDPGFSTTAVDVTLNGGTEYNGPGGTTVGWSLLGGGGADSIIGSADIDTALGGNGSDTINGGGGADSLDGGANDDLFLFSTRATFAAVGNGGATASLIGGSGTDTISITTTGQSGVDAIVDGDFTKVDSVEALLVADGTGSEVTINTEAQLGGIVSLFGGTGGDTLTAGAAYSGTSVTLVGNAGADSLTSNTAVDLILGGNGNDTINGGGGADSLDGGADDDLFLFSTRATFAAVGNGGATASLIGGSGTDTISITTAGQSGVDAIVDNDFTKVDSVGALLVADGTGSEVAINTEAQLGGIVSLFGGTGGDTFTAGAAYNATSATLVGNAGADSLTSNAAADLILGGNGNDTINGGGGADNLDGGADDDSFVFASATALNAAATIKGGSGTDTISIADAGSAVVDSDLDKVDLVEALEFTAGGNCSADLNLEAQFGGIVSVFGGVGNDTLTAGTAYNDTSVTLVGNNGADSLTTADASDYLDGGNGADTLQGFNSNANVGIDTLTGGADADTFVIGVSAENGYGSSATGDIASITDFNTGADIVQIDDLGFGGAGWAITQVVNDYVITNGGVNQYGLARTSGTEVGGDAVWTLKNMATGIPANDNQLAEFKNIDSANLTALTTVGNWSFV